jgi:hypothetical protein
MDRTLISWNLPNWITVMLMATAGYLVLALASQVIMNRGGQAGGGGAY